MDDSSHRKEETSSVHDDEEAMPGLMDQAPMDRGSQHKSENVVQPLDEHAQSGVSLTKDTLPLWAEAANENVLKALVNNQGEDHDDSSDSQSQLSMEELVIEPPRFDDIDEGGERVGAPVWNPVVAVAPAPPTPRLGEAATAFSPENMGDMEPFASHQIDDIVRSMQDLLRAQRSEAPNETHERRLAVVSNQPDDVSIHVGVLEEFNFFDNTTSSVAENSHVVPDADGETLISARQRTEANLKEVEPLTPEELERLNALQLIEEERSSIMNYEVARYLQSSRELGQEVTFQWMVELNLIAPDVMTQLEMLDSILAQSAEVPGSPSSHPSSPLASPLQPPQTVTPAPDPSIPGSLSIGKGKGVDRDEPMTVDLIDTFRCAVPEVPVTANCGICFDTLTILSPASVGASSSSGCIPSGIQLPCPHSHTFCLQDLHEHIRIKLYSNPSPFPIRCPECLWEIDDEIAERVLGDEALERWRREKILLELPGMMFCPRATCSEILAPADEDEDTTSAECPSCHVLLCFKCRSIWHGDMTCQESKLFKENNSEEDQALYTLARAEQQQWRRCPSCRMIVNKVEGCHHLTCRCGYEFCWLCGKQFGNEEDMCAASCGRWIDDTTLVPKT